MLSTRLRHKEEKCDACKVTGKEQVLEICQSSRRDRNIVLIHKSCLLKQITKAERDFEKEKQ